MSRARALLSAAVITAAAAALSIRAQSQTLTTLFIREGVGLPAVDEGPIYDDTHTPSSLVATRRAQLEAGLHRTPRLIVKFREGMSEASRSAAVRAAAPRGELNTRLSHADFDLLTFAAGENVDTIEAASTRLNERPDVEYTEKARGIAPAFVPNDPFYKSSAAFPPGQWNLPLLNLESAWDIQPQAGSSIVVAVIDSGIAYQTATITATLRSFVDGVGTPYPALGVQTIPYAAASQLVSPGRIVAPFDFIWNTDRPLDFSGHGTHVAGTIGQLTNDSIGTAGVAFNVKLMPIKVLYGAWDDIFNAPIQGDIATLAQGIRYAADNGAKVINISIGVEGIATSMTLENAIRYAVGKGAFLSIAAGNFAQLGNPRSVLGDIASRVDGAVSVAAIDRNATLGDHRCRGTPESPSCHAYYSSFGSWVELSAPGGSDVGFGRTNGSVYQQTFDPNFVETFLLSPAQYRAPRFDIHAYVGYIGTSMAAPHVAGVAAMLMQQGITDPAAVEAALERFAIDLGAPGRDNEYGYGLVDARASLRGLGAAR